MSSDVGHLVGTFLAAFLVCSTVLCAVIVATTPRPEPSPPRQAATGHGTYQFTFRDSSSPARTGPCEYRRVGRIFGFPPAGHTPTKEDLKTEEWKNVRASLTEVAIEFTNIPSGYSLEGLLLIGGTDFLRYRDGGSNKELGRRRAEWFRTWAGEHLGSVPGARELFNAHRTVVITTTGPPDVPQEEDCGDAGPACHEGDEKDRKVEVWACWNEIE